LRYGDKVIDRSAVRNRRGRRVGVRVDDFVATLLALANYRGDAAKDTFALGVRAFLRVAEEDFGRGGEARPAEVCWDG
jgi:hypothetical protein